MFVDKADWLKLKENIDGLYWDVDRMSRDGRYFLKEIDKSVAKIESNQKLEVYVITSNSIIDDEISNEVNGIALSKEEAKEMLDILVEKLKEDIEFDNMDAQNESDIDTGSYDGWVYDSTDTYFQIYLNGEYNSNSVCISIDKFELTKNKYREKNEIEKEV